MSEFVLFIHGDLLTKEHLDTIRDSRHIEDTPKNRFQFVVFLLGLFHYKMACADALWRTYVQEKEGRSNLNSTYQHVGILQPRETGIMTTKPGFCQMHDVVHHELCATILECWWIEVSALDPENWTSLEAFTASKLDWDLVVKISEEIVQKYVATIEGLSQARMKPETERDQQFENQTLRNRDYLLYVDLCNTMNAGDISHVEASFLPWIYIFCTMGKHKYVSQLARFMKNLHEVYPPALSGPNSNIDYICKQSPLIEVFRSCHVMVESVFQLTHCTLKHMPLDMTATIERLHAYMQSSGTCEFRQGRVVDQEIADNLVKGFHVSLRDGDWTRTGILAVHHIIALSEKYECPEVRSIRVHGEEKQ
ncbi:hypothetical protein EDB89DRAFT_2113744 [Lactarius sanguifluus]|nr:hypothetical protein EDB89DRAFT_2113744 [Lactarius sanguifluus]